MRPRFPLPGVHSVVNVNFRPSWDHQFVEAELSVRTATASRAGVAETVTTYWKGIRGLDRGSAPGFCYSRQPSRSSQYNAPRFSQGWRLCCSGISLVMTYCVRRLDQVSEEGVKRGAQGRSGKKSGLSGSGRSGFEDGEAECLVPTIKEDDGDASHHGEGDHVSRRPGRRWR